MVERVAATRRDEARREISQGWELMKFGLVETVRSEISHAAAMGLIGGVIGVGAWALHGNRESIVKWAKKLGTWGSIS